jgi:hypothetical protein
MILQLYSGHLAGEIHGLINYILGNPELVGNPNRVISLSDQPSLFFVFKRASNNRRPILNKKNKSKSSPLPLKSYQKIPCLNPYPKIFQ